MARYDNVTEYVVSAQWFLGNKKPYKEIADDSILTLVLTNVDKRFSPENGSGVLTGKLAPFRRIRIQSNDGSTTRTHWVGWIESIQPDVNQYGNRQVTITAAGPGQFFSASETSIELQENQRTDEIIAQLIEEVVIPPALSGAWFLGLQGSSELGQSTHLADTENASDLETGRVTLAIAADNWVHRDREHATFNVYRAISDVVAAERGRFFFDREGKAVFWNRHHLQDEITSSLTLDDDMTDLRYVYAGSQADFKNEVIVTCHPRVVGTSSNEVLWTLDKEVRIPAGETRTITVRYQDADAGNARIGAKDVTLDGTSFSQGTATITLSAKANSASLEVTNSGSEDAILSAATVRGTKITDYGRMEAESRDGLSIAKYGRRSLKMSLSSVDSLEYAQAIADYEIGRRSEPRGAVKEVSLRSHGIEGSDNHAQQLARTIGDVVTISETQTAHTSKKYVVIGEAHNLRDGASNYETTWYLEPVKESPYPWKLGVTGRSELGTKTHLAF
jgi:hypothetical protein